MFLCPLLPFTLNHAIQMNDWEWIWERERATFQLHLFLLKCNILMNFFARKLCIVNGYRIGILLTLNMQKFPVIFILNSILLMQFIQKCSTVILTNSNDATLNFMYTPDAIIIRCSIYLFYCINPVDDDLNSLIYLNKIINMFFLIGSWIYCCDFCHSNMFVLLESDQFYLKHIYSIFQLLSYFSVWSRW